MDRGPQARASMRMIFLKTSWWCTQTWSQRWVRIMTALGVPLILVACGSMLGETDISPQNPKLVAYGDPVPKGGGVFKVGNPYQIAGRWYYPKDDPNYNEVGMASWYGLDFHGRRTANGEIYDMDALSAAHPTLPMPTYARVTNLQNGKQIVVRINDRGPYAHDRIIDLSKRAAEALGFDKQGLTRVRVTYLGRAPLNGDDNWQTAMHRSENNPVQQAQAPATTPPANVGSGATSAAGTSGQHYVQAAAFRDENSANRLRQQLAGLGPVSITPANVGNLTYYRVRVGPFAGQADAEAALSSIEARGISGPRIVSGG